jgi:outer membrane protein OmpA-like peptidoglycan-associated protein
MIQPSNINPLKYLIIVLLVSTFTTIQAQQKLMNGISLPNSVDYAPSISADGNTLIFQSNRDGKFNLYLSTKSNNGVWSEPKSLDKINNFGTSSDLIGGPTISYDGNILIYFATFKGGQGNEDIWYSLREGDDFGEPVNLGAEINSKDYEGFPSISSDGEKIYFMRNSKTQNVPGAFCYSIWTSERNGDGEWEKPTLLPSPINIGCEKSPRIMSDNEMLIFASIRKGGMSANKFDLYYSRLDKQGNWGEVKSLDYINTPENETFAAVSACGETLYFVSPAKKTAADTTEGGFKDLDLFSNVMTKESKPKPVMLVKGTLKDEINGAALFGTITIIVNDDYENEGILVTNSEDGSFTLVQTKGNKYDVTFTVDGYYPKEIEFNTDDLADCETEFQNIKLKRWEGYYTLNTLNSTTNSALDTDVQVLLSPNNTAVPIEKIDKGQYKASIKGGEVYTVRVSGEGINDTTYSFIPRVDDIKRKGFEETITVKVEQPRLNIRIVNKETREEVPNAILLLVEAKSRKTMHRAVLKGDSTFDIKYDETYVMLGVAANHFRTREILDVTKSGKRGLIEMEIELVELKPGAKLVVNNITFASNSSELRKSSFEEINQVIAVLKQNTHIKIEIGAHTDDIGENEPNMTLSNARAKTVLDYMISKGIATSRLLSKGYGETDPAVPNNSLANRALNRRVEFRIPKN